MSIGPEIPTNVTSPLPSIIAESPAVGATPPNQLAPELQKVSPAPVHSNTVPVPVFVPSVNSRLFCPVPGVVTVTEDENGVTPKGSCTFSGLLTVIQSRVTKKQSIKPKVAPSRTLVNPLEPAGPSHMVCRSPPFMVTLPVETTILSAIGTLMLLSISNTS